MFALFIRISVKNRAGICVIWQLFQRLLLPFRSFVYHLTFIMSARSKRSATPAKTPSATRSASRQPSEIREEPPAAPQPAPRPGSPLSPTIISRRQEKNDLKNLNDRLAQYIDLVQRLQNEKSSLEYSLYSIEESHTTEFKKVKAASEKEIEDIRKALDRESSTKSALAIEKRRLQDEVVDLKAK